MSITMILTTAVTTRDWITTATTLSGCMFFQVSVAVGDHVDIEVNAKTVKTSYNKPLPASPSHSLTGESLLHPKWCPITLPAVWNQLLETERERQTLLCPCSPRTHWHHQLTVIQSSSGGKKKKKKQLTGSITRSLVTIVTSSSHYDNSHATQWQYITYRTC